MPTRTPDDRPDPASRELDSCFEAARAAPPEPPDALLARIAADGLAQQEARAAARQRGARRLPRMMAGLRWQGAGLAAALALGLFIGVRPPETLAAALWDTGEAELLVDPVSAYDLAWYEE
ncbi:dihydroorotate dehydrogenase [Roseivivax sediminis]|uniref:DUF3619 family protein n=1 Tax=Roseivivax sediminis TaxID=936889 RepID=A0A1I1TBP9_9RHOB|nr:dihydroorotate dehydrogenase [Roseivivax sediminis]SFD56006.1 hypothetical protein SAMN04515678_101570 [Roseivivax sediminis]